MAKKSKKRRKKKNKALRALLIILIITLAAAYGAGWYLLYGRFLPNTRVNGVEYSHMDAAEAEAFFKTTYMGRTLKIHEMNGGEEEISYDDIGYHLTSNMSFQQLIDDQDYFLWPVTYFRHTLIETMQGFAYDEEKLRQEMNSLNCISGPEVRDPSDAFLEKTAEGYSIHPEDDGTRLDEEKVFGVLNEAVNAGAGEVSLEEKGCYLKAGLRSDNQDLQASFAAADKVQNTVVTAYMEGGKSVVIDKSVFLDWMTVNGTDVNISSDAVIKYTAQLADEYNTYGRTRQFITYEGDVLTVGGSAYDNFGYQMNQETSAAIIRDAIMSGTTQTVALDWTSYGRERDDLGGDFGNTYIEISLDQQHMWFYKDGELFSDTAIVSGTATPTRATPPGVFCILQKLQDHTMRGSYGESYANYVMAIMYNGIAIHDSSWRGEYDYGGDIWLYDGSHGCINTPYSAVKKIYENVSESTPVVIYDRENHVTEIHNETYTGGETDNEGTEEEYYEYLENSLELQADEDGGYDSYEYEEDGGYTTDENGEAYDDTYYESDDGIAYDEVG